MAGTRSTYAAMTASASRSPSPISRRRRYCLRAWVTFAVAILALVCVRAVTGRGHAYTYLIGANSTPLIPSFRRPGPDADTWGRVGATQDHAGQIPSCPSAQYSSSSSSSSSSSGGGWIGSFKRYWNDAINWPGRLLAVFAGHDHLPPSPSYPAELSDSDSDLALGLASSTRGGGGQRGWWYPGKRARQRRNLQRAAERAASKRSAASGSGLGGASGLPPGLANQGNTCYLNSLLQTLYHAPGLREAVLDATASMGVGDGDAATVSALATVFRQLDQGGRPASTLPLTRAMGVDPRVQQDAQEFGRFLFMALEGEESKKQTSAADRARGDGDGDADKKMNLAENIKELFAGRLIDYIECVDVPFSKEREEVFYDLPLDIKGSGTLQKSLDRFIEAELLTGENRWRAGDHGLQDARKGMRFLTLPGVLQFHLKRFEYDPFRDDLAKIHDRFEFPTELDMSPWLQAKKNVSQADKDAASSDDSSEIQVAYRLSAVVMHVGGPAAGHYYAYVRYRKSASFPPAPGSPDGLKAKPGWSGKCTELGKQPQSTWVKLDDHRVTKVSEAEVLRDAFGDGGAVYTGPGADLQGFFGQVQGSGGRGTASAYMLQYVRVRDHEQGEQPEEEEEGERIEEASECAQP